MKENVHVIFHSESILEELSARQLFSGGVEGILAASDAATHQELEPQTNLTIATHQELVFIDTDVENYQQLLNDIIAQDIESERNIEVILLDNDRDGIEQISEALTTHQNLDAVHLISHGSDGQIDLGNSILDVETLNQNLVQISSWGDAFTEQGDFLIYGCNLAASDIGQSLVLALSTLTHTDVAASDDITGHAELGGDWSLEYQTGTIESSVAISSETQQEWNSTLVSPVTADIEPTELVYTENDPATAITSTITISDVDSLTLNSATVQITGNYVNGEDILSFNNTSTIIATWSPATGTLVLGGSDTVANYETALRNVLYQNLSDTPTPATRTVTLSLRDDIDQTSNILTRDISVTPLNDAPTFGSGDGIVTTHIGSTSGSNSIVVQPDGKIISGGYSYNGVDYDYAFVRYNTNGSLDTQFGIDGIATVSVGPQNDLGYSLTLQADGKIVLFGKSTNASGDIDIALVRLTATGQLDNSFSEDGIVITTITSGIDYASEVTIQADGKLVVAGFTDLGLGSGLDYMVARYNTDGSLDTSFGGDGIVVTAVGTAADYGRTVAIQSDGKILLGGYSAGNNTAIVRYNIDGTLDTSFGGGDGILTTNVITSASQLLLQPDGKIIITGTNFYSHFTVARFNLDGSIDTSFGGGNGYSSVSINGDEQVNSAVLQDDGKIILTGWTWDTIDYNVVVVRFNADGSLDTSFGGSGVVVSDVSQWEWGSDIAIQPDGKIVISVIADNDFMVVRYNPDGSLDTNFDSNLLNANPTFTEGGPAIILDSDVQVFDAELSAADNYNGSNLTLERNITANSNDVFSASGNLAALTEGNDLNLSGTVIGTVTINSAGTLLLSFNANATQALVNETLQSIAYSNSSDNPDNSVQINWTFNDGNTGAQGAGGALSTTGNTIVNITAVNNAPIVIDDTAVTNEDINLNNINVLGNDYDLEGDALSVILASAEYGSVLINADGSLNYTPYANFNGTDTITYILSDGDLTDTGTVTITVNAVNDAPSFFISEGFVTTDIAGSIDLARDITVLADGKLLVAGNGYNSNHSDFSMVRYHADGSLDTSFGSDGIVTTDISASDDFAANMEVLSDGKILLGGYFWSGTGAGAGYDFALVRYNADGSLDSSFGDGDGVVTTNVTGPEDYALTMTMQSDGKILLAGVGSNSGTRYDFILARYHPDGSLDSSFDGDGLVTTDIAASTDVAFDVTIQSDGKIILAGYSNTGTNNDFSLSRYNTDGSLDTSFGGGDGIVTTDNTGGTDSAFKIAIQADGKLIVVGGSNNDFALTRYHADGSVDTRFNLVNTLAPSPIYGPTVILDSDVQIFDTELSSADNFSGASLTLSRNTGANVDDIFSATGNMAALTEGGDLAISGTVIGSITINSSGTLVLTFNNNATQARVNEAMQSIAYNNSAGTAHISVQIDWLFNDGNTGSQGIGGALEASGNSSITTNGSLVANNDTAIVDEDITLTNINVLANDSDADGDTLTVTTASAINGTVSINLDGSLNYTPNSQFNGSDTIIYSISDGYGSTATASVAITVNAVNDAPTFGRNDGIVTTDIDARTDSAKDIVIQTDGKILVAGTSNQDFTVTRYHTNGSLDTSFGGGDGVVITDIAGGNDFASNITLQDDGKFIVVGSSRTGSNTDFTLVRYHSDGSLDSSFGGDGIVVTDITPLYDAASDIIIQADGKILITGSSNNSFTLVRYNTDGSLDTSFGNAGIATPDVNASRNTPTSISLQDDGKILVSGTEHSFTNGNVFKFLTVRYNSDGSLDSSFGINGSVTTGLNSNDFSFANSLTVQEDGKILVVGQSYIGGNGYDFVLVRYNTDGSVDTSFGAGDGLVITDIAGSNNAAFDLVIQSDGKILLAGYSYTGTNGFDFALARYNIDGSLDTQFANNGIITTDISGDGDQAFSLALQGDGKIILAGQTRINASTDIALARYNADGTLDTSFDGAILNGNPTFTEGGAAVILDIDVQVFDIELVLADNFDGATLTLARHALVNPVDVFSATGNLSPLTEGASLTVSGTIIGTVSNNSAGTLSLSFNSNATQALVNQTLQSLAYSNSSQDPVASVQIDWIFTDGNTGEQGSGGTLQAIGSTTVNITAVNDAPIASNDTVSTNEDIDLNDINVLANDSDIDGDSLSVTLATAEHGIVLINNDGSLNYSPNTNFNGSDIITYTLSDGTLTDTGRVTITVNAINDAPNFYVSDGTILTNAGSHDWVHDVTFVDDGKILVTGYQYAPLYFIPNILLVRYNADGSIDTSFGGGDGIVITDIAGGDDKAVKVEVLADGKILVGGSSSSDFALIRYNADGSLDTSFGTAGVILTDLSNSNDSASDMSIQADGKILLSGRTLSLDSSGYDFALLRYNSDGSLDTSFGGGDGIITTDIANNTDYSAAVTSQADGKIILAGYSRNSDNYYDYTLVRYNSDGSLDASFGNNGIVITDIATGSDYARDLIIQADGKLVVAGSGTNDFAIARYNADGSLDTSFANNGIAITDISGSIDHAYDVAQQIDGKLVVAGNSYIDGDSDFVLLRYNTDGSLDTSFDSDGIVSTDVSGGHDYARGLEIQPDGKLVVAGYSNNGGIYDVAIARYNTDGSLDNQFNLVNTLASPLRPAGTSVILDSDVQIFDAELSAADNFAGASLTLVRNTGANVDDIFSAAANLASIIEGNDLVLSGVVIGSVTTNSAGTLVLTFNNNATQPHVNEAMQSLAYSNNAGAHATVQIDWLFNDGNTVSQGTGGALDTIGSSSFTTNDIVIANNDTAITDEDITLNNINVLANDSDGDGDSLTVTSAFTSNGTVSINPDSSLNYTPNSQFNGSDTIYYSITDAYGSTASASVVITVNAVNDAPSFGRHDGIVTTDIDSQNDYAKDIVIQDDGKLLIAGVSDNNFTLARYTNDGSLDITFGDAGIIVSDITTGTETVASVLLQNDGKIVVAGSSRDGSNTNFLLVRYLSDGSLDTSFGGGDGIVITDISGGRDFASDAVIQTDGKIIITGVSDNEFALVRYNTDGSLDTSFGTNGIATPDVNLHRNTANAISLLDDGKILVSGTEHSFTGAGNVFKFLTVRYNSDGSIDTSFGTEGSVATDLGLGLNFSYGMTVQDNGKILVSGTTISHTYNWEFSIVRYNPDGSLDTSFDGDGIVTTNITGSSEYAYDVQVQADGKILLVGSSNGGLNGSDSTLVRYNIDGSLDTSFGRDGIVTTDIAGSSNSTNSLALQDDGKIVLVGQATINANNDIALIRYNADGTLDTSFEGSLLNGNPTFIEGGTAVILDIDVQVFDIELDLADNFDGATLTLARHALANPVDVFSATGNLSPLTEGASLTVSSTIIGTVSNNSAGTLSLSFNSNATQTLVNETLQSIAYSNNSDNPEASVQIDWSFTDGNTGAQGSGGAHSALGSTTVNILAVNDAPIAINDIAATNEDINLNNINVLGNDSDLEGDTLSVILASAVNGTVSINVDGSLNYSPNINFNGTDTISYTISDGDLTDTGTLTISVNAVNDQPTIQNTVGTQNLIEDFASYTIDLNSAFSDIETPDTSLIYNVTGNSNINVSITNGIATISNTADWNGSESLTFIATDSGGLTSEQAITFNVSAVNDSVDDLNVIVNEDILTLIDVLANDSFEGSPVITATSATSNGTVEINADNTLTYTPDRNYVGQDEFTYEVTSGGITEVKTVTLSVLPVLDLSAQDNSFTTNEDVPLNASVSGNDSTTSGGLLTFSVVTEPSDGTLEFYPDGTFTFTPLHNFNGTDSFTYKVEDVDSGESAIRTASITINAVNDRPILNSIRNWLITDEDISIHNINVLQYAHDVDGDSLFISQVISRFSEVTINSDNTLNYTPAPDYFGFDYIIYSISDGNGGTSYALIYITVNPIADVVDNGPLVPIPSDNTIPTKDDGTPKFDESNTGKDIFTPRFTLEQGPNTILDDSNLVAELSVLDIPSLVETKFNPRGQEPLINTPSKFSDIVSQFKLSDSDLWQQSQQQSAQGDINSISTNTSFSELNNTRSTEILWENVNLMRLQMDADAKYLQYESIEIEFVAGATTVGVAAGFVSWVLRGGALLSSLLTSVSVFNKFDPLAVVQHNNNSRMPLNEKESAIEAMFGKKPGNS